MIRPDCYLIRLDSPARSPSAGSVARFCLSLVPFGRPCLAQSPATTTGRRHSTTPPLHHHHHSEPPQHHSLPPTSHRTPLSESPRSLSEIPACSRIGSTLPRTVGTTQGAPPFLPPPMDNRRQSSGGRGASIPAGPNFNNTAGNNLAALDWVVGLRYLLPLSLSHIPPTNETPLGSAS